jgi:acetylornithine/N-succinyldiaminopimelate aminotransferase
VPIGACLARGAAAETFTPGQHASTFGGNPLACSAALSVLETIENDNLLVHAAETGAYLLDGLRRALADMPHVNEVRGRGMILGIELTSPCGELVGRAVERGLLINVTAERVVRLLPPLILSRAEADQIVETLAGLVGEFGAAAA